MKKFLNIFFILLFILITLNLSLAQNGILSGKTIVIDPGHGGKNDPGAVGVNGLKESDLNLKVALYLYQLLIKDGANVILTRKEDKPCVDNDAEDLKARADIANRNNADLFISIHHNSSSSESRYTANETQVYYRIMDDDGPSYDFAKILINKLTQAMKAPKSVLLPGNYAVLKYNTRPAILGEANYISNPNLEKLFKSPYFQQKEAYAYYESIIEYFKKGVPYVKELNFIEPFYNFELLLNDKVGIKRTDIFINDKLYKTIYQQDKIKLNFPTNLLSGTHTLTIKTRNLNNNSSIPFNYTFTISKKPSELKIQLVPFSINQNFRDRVLLKVTVLDGLGNFVLDGTPVYFTIGQNSFVSKTYKGIAYLYPNLTDFNIKIECGDIAKELIIEPQTTVNTIIGKVICSKTFNPIENVKCKLDQKYRTITNNDGVFYFENLEKGRHNLNISINGYKSLSYAFDIKNEQVLYPTVTLKPLYNGLMHKKRIILDTDNSNKIIAYRLKDKLEEAGAEILIFENLNNNIFKIKQSMKFQPELYIKLNYSNKTYVSHYYRSNNGKRLALLLKNNLKNLSINPSTEYLITHTPCPTVYLGINNNLGNIQRIFNSILKYFE